MLATYLRVTAAQLSRLEAGQRGLGAATTQRLLPLLQIALASAATSASSAAYLAPPDAAPLQARLADCQHQVRKLGRELKILTEKLGIAQRWQVALPTLLAGAADERARAWLLRRQEQAAADLDGDTAARYHLLRLRLAALDGEAAALTGLLGAEEDGQH